MRDERGGSVAPQLVCKLPHTLLLKCCRVAAAEASPLASLMRPGNLPPQARSKLALALNFISKQHINASVIAKCNQ